MRIHLRYFTFNFDKSLQKGRGRGQPRYMYSRYIAGIAPPSYRKGVDSWD